MLHPKTELRFINDQVGYGVFATDMIPEGSIVYVKDSLELEISPEDYLLHSKEVKDAIDKYSYIDERGYRIVSWDFAKYVNHCCNCNTISTGYGFEIAIRDIQPGEQITDEYGVFNLDTEMVVQCSAGSCRKVIRPNDFDLYYEQWDAKIRKSIMNLFEVSQPLMTLLDEKTKKQLSALAKDPSKYTSVYSLRYKPNTGATRKKMRAV